MTATRRSTRNIASPWGAELGGLPRVGGIVPLPFSYRFFHNTQIAQSCADAPIAMIAMSIMYFIVSLIGGPNSIGREPTTPSIAHLTMDHARWMQMPCKASRSRHRPMKQLPSATVVPSAPWPARMISAGRRRQGCVCPHLGRGESSTPCRPRSDRSSRANPAYPGHQPSARWVDSKDSLLRANQIQGFFLGGSFGCDGSFGVERRGLGAHGAPHHRPA
jgi:hypothetical protein